MFVVAQKQRKQALHHSGTKTEFWHLEQVLPDSSVRKLLFQVPDLKPVEQKWLALVGGAKSMAESLNQTENTAVES